MVKVIDGMVFNSEIDKWITIEEHNKMLNEEIEIECSAEQDWAWYYESI